MSILNDLRHAVRLLGRSPVFTVTATLSLALGVAASSTIFSLTDALLLAPPPGVRDPGRVVDIGRSSGGSGFDNMSHPAFRYLRDHTQTLEAMAALDFSGGPMSLSDGRSSERIFARMASANYFDLLGARPALGRFFHPDEERVPGEHPVVVLTHEFWTRRFAGDPAVVGTRLRLNNVDFTVIGVTGAGFTGTSLVGADAWTTMAMVATVRGRATSAMLDEPRAVWHVAAGRLKPGVSREQAQAELNTLMEAFKASEPRANPTHGITVASLSRVPGPVRLPFTAFVGFLFALTGALLAIACSNVAGMMLARAAARRREIATRLAIGASRGRIVGQLLTETVVLFALAGLVALPLTYAFVGLLTGFLPALPIPLNMDLAVNARVVAFALGLAFIAALVFGLAPARQAVGGDLAPSLHGAYATADRRRFRLRNVLVTAQVALSLMLVVTAFMFVRTLQNAAEMDPGFQTANITLASVDVGLSGFRGPQAVALIERMQSRLSAVGGVESVAAARMIPLQGSGFGLGRIRIQGRVSPRGDDTLDADWNVISPEYFTTLGIRIVEGRAFTAADRAGGTMVAVVNETFARTAWPGQLAVGQRFLQGSAPGDGEDRPVEVVGVVADAKYRYISEEPASFVFVPLAQQPITDTTFFIRHAGDRAVGAEVRTALAQVEPGVPVLFLQSFEEATALGLLPQRLAAWVAGSVGSVGIFLAALGLYGLMAFLVAQRTREIAIRMALGASREDMQRMVMGQAARLGVAGAGVGIVLASGLGVLMQSLLVGVPPIDPLSVGATALLFAGVLTAASWAPARRAATTDPAVALRAE
ncbi:MAG: ABC transporter permease [Vicinamibacterales bacterium]|nr:ABC transporter permease [Vicinamibacterales bacterium]